MESTINNSSAFQALYSNTWESVVIIDRAHTLLMCNNAAVRTFEANGKKVLLNTDVRQYFQPDSVQVYLHAFDLAMEGETSVVERQRVIDGKEQWFRHKMSPVYNGRKEVIGVTLATTDIDAEKAAQREKEIAEYRLRERVKELKTLYYSSKTLLDEKRSIHEAFALIAKVIPQGWQYPEVCGARIIFEGVEHLSENFAQPVAVQTAAFTTHDGKTGIVEVSYSAEKASDYEGPFLKEERELINNLAEMFSVHYNERSANSELRKSEANLRSVFESTDVGHLLIDAQHRVVAFNHSMQSGYAKGTGIILKENDHFADLMDAERSARLLARLEKIAATGQPEQYDASFEREGRHLHFIVSIHPVKGQNKDIIGYSISIADITQRRELEIERQHVIEELVARNKDLEQFAYMISHNIRSPLAHILGLTDLLSYDLPDSDKQKATLGIQSAAQQLDKVLSDTSEILTAKRTNAERKSVLDLNTISSEVITGLSTVIRQADARIDCDFSRAPEVFAIRTYVQNIFTNAITNTIRYAKPGERPVLHISSESEGRYCALKFSDEGIGLDLNLAGDKLFGIYQRFHGHEEGRGLGLFMIKTQVELMGGDVHVNSKPGEGFHLIVRLPHAG